MKTTIGQKLDEQQKELFRRRLEEIFEAECGSIVLINGKKLTDLHIGYCKDHLAETLDKIKESGMEYFNAINP